MNIENKREEVKKEFQELSAQITELRNKIQEAETRRVELQGQYKLLEEMDNQEE